MDKLTIAKSVALLNLAVAIVMGFIVGDNALYHWWVCAVAGLVGAALAAKARSIPWAIAGVLSAVAPAILMFGSWFIYTLVNM